MHKTHAGKVIFRAMRLLLGLVVALVAQAAALTLPTLSTRTTRRLAVGALFAAPFAAPQLASAAYRPSLAEFKGYGSSPVVDEKEAPKTDLSFAELVANSIKMQEDMLGRPLDDAEKASIAEKIKKYYPNAR